MSNIRVYELLDSMSGSVTTEQGQSEVKEVRRRYVIGQCESFDDCVEQIAPFAPRYAESAEGYWIRSSLSINGIGNKYFDITATYKTLVPGSGGGQNEENNGGGGGRELIPGSVSWDSSGHTEHITQAYSQERVPENAPDFEGAINVSGDSVQGMDVSRPAMRYSETWIMPVRIAMGCTFINAVYTLTGTINKYQFRCFGAGECLFVGARGQWQEDQPYVTVTFEFEARANSPEYYPWEGAGFKFAKKGWEHVWLLYEDAVDADTIIKRPVAAYKSVVFKEREWDGLLIVRSPISKPRRGSRSDRAAAAGAFFGKR